MADYICAECGGAFDFAWTDEEAREEHRANFGVEPEDLDSVLVCEECYQRLRRELVG